MLQRSSLPSTVSADAVESWRNTLDRPSLQSLRHTLQLPTTWQQYALLLTVLMLIIVGMTMHILLTVQIAEAEYQVRLLQTQYERVERQNSELVYQISTHSSLAELATAASAQGYKPTMSRTYIYRNQLAGSVVPGLGGRAGTESAGFGAGSQSATPQGFPTQNSDSFAGAQQWLQGAQAATGEFVSQIADTITGWTR